LSPPGAGHFVLKCRRDRATAISGPLLEGETLIFGRLAFILSGHSAVERNPFPCFDHDGIPLADFVQAKSIAKSADFPHFFEPDFRWVFAHGMGGCKGQQRR
jgi:hypothetical protein